ncbi:MAG: CBS domain-containing protein [Chloroflexi bacterium]|uniref:histidine kinase n=1 Tax=Candidatus Chlorohelix allophototropha TaxID=3003348 RepID=A0A8T7M2F6_9CHLR|nr:CBS domain-containing protein [Chloroflexota bacterium]WJW66456.1 CBS domain-containing protein [Chloroflexota bacterium L227-S17]
MSFAIPTFLPTLEQILDPNPLILPLETPVDQLLNLLGQSKSSCALIMEGPRLIGIFTQRDGVKLAASAAALKDIEVSKVITRHVITIAEEDFVDIFSVLRLFHQFHIRHLPVVDQEGHLTGIITTESIRQALQPLNMFKLREVKDVINNQVYYISPQNSVMDVARMMTEQRISCVIVAELKTGAGVIPQGIITERDIVMLRSQHIDFEHTPAQTVMSSPLHLLKSEDTLWHAHQLMQQLQVRRLVVVGKHSELAGIITQSDLIKLLDPVDMVTTLEMFQRTIQRLENEKLDLLENRNKDLENMVTERTGELQTAVEQTQIELGIRKQTEETLKRANRTNKMLGEANEAMLKASDETALLKEICRITVEEGGYPLAWVGFAREKNENVVQPMAYWGEGGDALENLSETCANATTEIDPTCRAFQTSRPVICNNFQGSSSCTAWQTFAIQLGFTSSIALPLIYMEKLLGTITIYATAPNSFFHEEVELLSKLAGNLAYGITTLRTRQEREKAEEQLRQSQKMEAVGRLAGGIAHDFNNILTSILCESDFLLQLLPTNNSLREGVEEIKKGSERATELTRQLLAVSRKQVLQPRLFNLNDTIQNTEKMLRRVIRENIELQVIIKPQIPAIKADPGQLVQVILNLVVNAKDAMPKGGKLVIETSVVTMEEEYFSQYSSLKPGQYVLLSVTDTGLGIAPDILPHVFEPFFTTKELGKGTGLGLSTVYGIIEQSGGHIELHSRYGFGTSCKIYLPASKAEASKALKRQVEKVAIKGNETILAVEDDDKIRKIVGLILEKAGYKVLRAANPEEALEISREYNEPIHLLITDFIMPGKSGLELAKEIVQMRPSTKVLLMSGYGDKGFSIDKELESKIDFLPKPFTSSNLNDKVREVLGNSTLTIPVSPPI